MDEPDARLKADHIVLELDPIPTESTHNIKLYNQATLPQKIRDWLTLPFTLVAILAAGTSLAVSYGLLPSPQQCVCK